MSQKLWWKGSDLLLYLKKNAIKQDVLSEAFTLRCRLLARCIEMRSATLKGVPINILQRFGLAARSVHVKQKKWISTKFFVLATFLLLTQINGNCNSTQCPTGHFIRVRASQMMTDRAISQVPFTMKIRNSFSEIYMDLPTHLMPNELMNLLVPIWWFVCRLALDSWRT